MILAHKIALDPNNKQATYFARAAGTARFAYNMSGRSSMKRGGWTTVCPNLQRLPCIGS